MKYQFVPHSFQDWTPEEAASLDHTLEFILQYNRDAPFLDIASLLCQTANVDYASISELIPGKKNYVRTLAFVKRDSILDNVEYCVLGTPCENVIGHNICFYSSRVQEQFPTDDFLRYLSIESYLGTALNDKQDNTIGLVALLSCREIKNPAFLEYLIATVTPFLEEKLGAYRLLG